MIIARQYGSGDNDRRSAPISWHVFRWRSFKPRQAKGLAVPTPVPIAGVYSHIQSSERESRLQSLQGLECHLCRCHFACQGAVDDNQMMGPDGVRALADSFPREIDPIAISGVDKTNYRTTDIIETCLKVARTKTLRRV